MSSEAKELFRKAFGNYYAAASFVSTIVTFIPKLAFLRQYGIAITCLALVVLTFRAALSITAAKAQDKELEIDRLKGKVVQLTHELTHKPYPEHLKNIVNQALDSMILTGQLALMHIVVHGQLNRNHTVVGGVTLPQQTEQLQIAAKAGLIRFDKDSGMAQQNWIVNPQFRPILEDLLPARINPVAR